MTARETAVALNTASAAPANGDIWRPRSQKPSGLWSSRPRWTKRGKSWSRKISTWNPRRVKLYRCEVTCLIINYSNSKSLPLNASMFKIHAWQLGPEQRDYVRSRASTRCFFNTTDHNLSATRPFSFSLRDLLAPAKAPFRRHRPPPRPP